MPQLTARETERDRVGRAREHDELTIGIRQTTVKLEEVFLGRDAIVLASYQQDRRLHAGRIDHGEIRGHVEVGAGGDAVAEHELGIGERLRHPGSDVPGLSRVKMERIMSRPRGRRLWVR